MSKLSALLILSLIITACSSVPSWKKKGSNQEEAESALAMCQYQIGLAKIDVAVKEQMINNCMIGQGYRFK